MLLNLFETAAKNSYVINDALRTIFFIARKASVRGFLVMTAAVDGTDGKSGIVY